MNPPLARPIRTRLTAAVLVACTGIAVAAPPATRPTTAPAESRAGAAARLHDLAVQIQNATPTTGPAADPFAGDKPNDVTDSFDRLLAKEGATTMPATAPAAAPPRGSGGVVVVPSKKSAGPTADELRAKNRELAARIRKMNDAADADAGNDDKPAVAPPKPAATAVAAAKVAVFDLSTPVVERPSDFSLLGGDPNGTTLRSLVDRLHKAKADPAVQAVLITLGEPGTNLAQSQEVRDAMLEVRKAGKKVFVYADGYDTDTYTIATGASDVCILPGGEMMLPGVGLQTMYLKGMFDKLGVTADYVQIGAYKGAEEPLTRTGPSKEFAGQLDKLVDGLFDQVVDGIATNRNLPPEQVKAAIDESIMTADTAHDRGFVDHLVDRDGLKDLIAEQLGGEKKPDFVDDYAAPAHDDVDLSSPFAVFGLLMKKSAAVSDKPAVAVVYADGVIVDGSGGPSLTGGATIGSDNIRQAMREIAKDDHVKAVVIRINSPGGSALASEAMWQAVRRVAKAKPVVVSVGDMAASGGYYLACAGDHIFADRSAIVGSIGVVGGKFVTHGLYDKLGITTQEFARGRNADLFGSDEPFTDTQRQMVRSWMTQTYDQFTRRVMTTRGGKIAKIEDVAQGRIFVAGQAKDLGMVDEIGGCDKAVEYAAEQAHLKTDGYDVRVVPAPRTLGDLLAGNKGPAAAAALRPRVELSEASVLKAMPADVRSMVGEQLEILQLLQKRPVVLACPFVVRER